AAAAAESARRSRCSHSFAGVPLASLASARAARLGQPGHWSLPRQAASRRGRGRSQEPGRSPSVWVRTKAAIFFLLDLQWLAQPWHAFPPLPEFSLDGHTGDECQRENLDGCLVGVGQEGVLSRNLVGTRILSEALDWSGGTC